MVPINQSYIKDILGCVFKKLSCVLGNVIIFQTFMVLDRYV